jgi:hypothetical protein
MLVIITTRRSLCLPGETEFSPLLYNYESPNLRICMFVVLDQGYAVIVLHSSRVSPRRLSKKYSKNLSKVSFVQFQASSQAHLADLEECNITDMKRYAAN